MKQTERRIHKAGAEINSLRYFLGTAMTDKAAGGQMGAFPALQARMARAFAHGLGARLAGKPGRFQLFPCQSPVFMV